MPCGMCVWVRTHFHNMSCICATQLIAQEIKVRANKLRFQWNAERSNGSGLLLTVKRASGEMMDFSYDVATLKPLYSVSCVFVLATDPFVAAFTRLLHAL